MYWAIPDKLLSIDNKSPFLFWERIDIGQLIAWCGRAARQYLTWRSPLKRGLGSLHSRIEQLILKYKIYFIGTELKWQNVRFSFKNKYFKMCFTSVSIYLDFKATVVLVRKGQHDVLIKVPYHCYLNTNPWQRIRPKMKKAINKLNDSWR